MYGKIQDSDDIDVDESAPEGADTSGIRYIKAGLHTTTQHECIMNRERSDKDIADASDRREE